MTAPIVLPDRTPVASSDALMTMHELARIVIAHQVHVVDRLRSPVHTGEDPEHVHDMRVAIRRFRAATKMFSASLPASAPRVRKEFGWLGSALGSVRDFDVHIGVVEAWYAEADSDDERRALAPLLEALATRRHEARKAAVSALESPRFDAMLTAARSLTIRRPAALLSLGVPVVERAPEVIARLHRRVRALGREVDERTPAHVLHAMRIRTKRLRYGVEFVEDLYGRPARRFVRRVIDLQDVLGAHQDAVTGMNICSDIAQREASDVSVAFAAGRVAQRFDAEAVRARALVRDAYDRVRAKRWRRFRDAMARARDPGRKEDP